MTAIGTDFPGVLRRLMTHRRVGIDELAERAGLPAAAVRALLDGAPPSARQADALAPALGLHPDDLRVIARVPEPEPVAEPEPPAGPVGHVGTGRGTGREVADTLTVALALSAEQRAHLTRFAARQPRDRSAPRVERLRGDHEGGGAVLVELVRLNRCLPGPMQINRALAHMTEGRVGLSAPTVMGIAQGRVALTPPLVSGFAALLGIDPGVLGAVVGVAPDPEPYLDPRLSAEITLLLRACRGLTPPQAELLRREAESMLVPVPADADSAQWHRVASVGGQWLGAPRS
ncbi:helix-turn-helix domain-containing protein [Kitasatospora sp. NPDC001540]|uniref:helix-turn-helix domain-containing protein n=1 Tax=Kitasatospora sp. NPDC001540 TaxID=3364014 RepID=UPI0036CE59CE